MEDADVRATIERVEQLLEQLDDDPKALAAVQAVVELYGEGIRRLLDGADPVADELLSHLLLLHGLHPEPLEARVTRALDEVRPYLGSHGGGVELVSVEDGVVRLRLEGTCNGCPSSTATMKLAIEEAIERAAPEIDHVEAEGAVEASTPLLQIGGSASPGRGWTVAGAFDGLAGATLRQIEGTDVLFLGVDGELYAYRHACPACGASLETGELQGAELECGGCGRHFDVRRAGRCLDLPQLSLEPLPLLFGESGLVKVAVA